MATLTPDKIRYEHGLKICEKIIPWGAAWTKNYQSYRKGDKYKSDRYFEGKKPSYITIHNTDGNANAETYTRATWPNQNMGTVRVHYYVDDCEAWQNLREDEIGWHAGTGGLGPGNKNSIGIEIIMHGSRIKNDIQAEENGALLAAILLDRYGLGIDRLRTHRDWSGKQCPLYILPHWDSFVKSVQRYLAEIQGKRPENGKEATCEVEIRILKKGSKGEAVRAMQTLLNGYGYSCGSCGADGSFGGATDKALRAYQQAKGLAADGSCGGATWRKLLGL